LENLRRNFTQSEEFLLGFRQVIKLLNFARKFQFRGEDVFFLKGASIYQTLPTIAPVLYLSQCIVIGITTDVHPLNELLLLSGVWIDAIAMIDGQHSSIIPDLLTKKPSLNVNLRGSIPLKLTWGSPCIPTLT
jgi:hypothetical protein